MASDKEQFAVGGKLTMNNIETTVDLTCICCDKIVKAEVPEDITSVYPVYGGLIFRSIGNFGSTVFDPMVTKREEILQVIICDDCVKSRARKVSWIRDIRRYTRGRLSPFEDNLGSKTDE